MSPAFPAGSLPGEAGRTKQAGGPWDCEEQAVAALGARDGHTALPCADLGGREAEQLGLTFTQLPAGPLRFSVFLVKWAGKFPQPPPHHHPEARVSSQLTRRQTQVEQVERRRESGGPRGGPPGALHLHVLGQGVPGGKRPVLEALRARAARQPGEQRLPRAAAQGAGRARERPRPRPGPSSGRPGRREASALGAGRSPAARGGQPAGRSEQGPRQGPRLGRGGGSTGRRAAGTGRGAGLGGPPSGRAGRRPRSRGGRGGAGTPERGRGAGGAVGGEG